MKKIILILALVAISTSLASSKGNEDYKTTFEEFFVVSGADQQFDMLVDQLLLIMVTDQQLRTALENNRDEIYREIKDILVDSISPVYEMHLTQNDLKKAIKYYRSPAGARMVKAQPYILMDSLTKIGLLSADFQSVIEKYIH